MAFDWLRFLEQNHIEVKTSGKNVSRGNVAVHCPFCGPQDPSEHMSIRLDGKGWRCFRHPDHRGKNPARLVQMLLGCTWEHASKLVGNAINIPSDFMAAVRQQFESPPIIDAPPIKLPPEFKPLNNGLPSGRRFRNYLRRDRGFTTEDIAIMTRRYGLRYCTHGAYKGRIIFPVWFEGKLISWTGRTIYEVEELRYRTLSVDPERAEREGYPAARGAISHFLLWYDDLLDVDADTLVMMEGPFDALKVDMLGRRHGICGTCFFTSSPTEPQIELLHTLCPQFKRRVLLLDRGTLATSIRVSSMLSGLGVVTRETPALLKDPGEFTRDSFDNFALALERGLP